MKYLKSVPQHFKLQVHTQSSKFHKNYSRQIITTLQMAIIQNNSPKYLNTLKPKA